MPHARAKGQDSSGAADRNGADSNGSAGFLGSEPHGSSRRRKATGGVYALGGAVGPT